MVTRTSQEGFGPTATNSIRQRSNYRWFLRRTVKQSYRVTTLVLVVWQAKEVIQWLFTDRVYQGGLSLGFWDRKSRHLCQNYAISTWETGWEIAAGVLPRSSHWVCSLCLPASFQMAVSLQQPSACAGFQRMQRKEWWTGGQRISADPAAGGSEHPHDNWISEFHCVLLPWISSCCTIAGLGYWDSCIQWQ